MAKFQLEKQSRGDRSYSDKYEVIAESDDSEELEHLATKTKLRCGKTYYQVLVINELDEAGDVIDTYVVKEHSKEEK